MAFEYIETALTERKVASLSRSRIHFDSVGPRYLSFEGQQYLNFASNDYLGLSKIDGDEVAVPIGSSSSALVTGYQSAHVELEHYLKTLLGFESCLLFASGFSANASLLKTLMNHSDSEIFQDKLNHASLIDGGLAANASNTRFNHNDTQHLIRRLEKSKAHNKLIVSEGIFSMDGDSAPIDELVNIAKLHNAWLMIDDAHGFGIRGLHGIGSTEHHKPDILVVTFGKAVASMGAAILCRQSVAEYLVQFNREYTYSTSLSPRLAKLTLSQLNKVFLADHQRQLLKDNIAYFKATAAEAGLAMMPSNSAIQPIVLGDSETCLSVTSALRKQGVWATAIRPPTVRHNTARIRITLTAAHTHQDLKALVNALINGLQ